MNLSQEKIDLLAPAQRDQVMKLKQWKVSTTKTSVASFWSPHLAGLFASSCLRAIDKRGCMEMGLSQYAVRIRIDTARPSLLSRSLRKLFFKKICGRLTLSTYTPLPPPLSLLRDSRGSHGNCRVCLKETT